MAFRTFSKGDRVAIINSTLGGRALLEGYARIKKLLDTDEYYRVSFEECYESANRFVDPAAQAAPHAFIASLNEPADDAAIDAKFDALRAALA